MGLYSQMTSRLSSWLRVFRIHGVFAREVYASKRLERRGCHGHGELGKIHMGNKLFNSCQRLCKCLVDM